MWLCALCLVAQASDPYPLYYAVGIRADSSYLFVFCHGFPANNKHAYHYLDGRNSHRGTIPHSLVTFDFEDANSGMQLPELMYANFGQECDICRLKAVIDRLRIDYPGKKIVLYGVSRGAATAINFLGLYGSRYPEIKAAVLESSYESVPSVVTCILKRLWIQRIPGTRWMAYKIMQKLMPLYRPRGPQPIDLVSKIPDSVALLFIATKQDLITPVEDTQVLSLLAKSRSKIARKLVCDCIVDSGDHGNLLWDEEVGSRYREDVLSFYKGHQIE